MANLTDRTIVVLAGIARPEPFVATLDKVGARIAATYLFADHHRFSAREIKHVFDRARTFGALVVTTEKDRERLPDGLDLWLPRVSIRLGDGSEALKHRLGW